MSEINKTLLDERNEKLLEESLIAYENAQQELACISNLAPFRVQKRVISRVASLA